MNLSPANLDKISQQNSNNASCSLKSSINHLTYKYPLSLSIPSKWNISNICCSFSVCGKFAIKSGNESGIKFIFYLLFRWWFLLLPPNNSWVYGCTYIFICIRLSRWLSFSAHFAAYNKFDSSHSTHSSHSSKKHVVCYCSKWKYCLLVDVKYFHPFHIHSQHTLYYSADFFSLPFLLLFFSLIASSLRWFFFCFRQYRSQEIKMKDED